MKTKLFKRIGLLGLSTLTAFTFMSNVRAEAQCTTYKNYFYFFHTQKAVNFPASTVTDNYTKPYNSSTGYPFPLNASVEREGAICLTSDDGSKAQNINNKNCVDTWNLTKFYQFDPTSNGQGTTGTHNGKPYTYYETKTGDTVTRYYFHGKWYNGSGQESSDSGYWPVPSDRATAIAATIFPESTTVTRTEDLNFSLSRTYTAENVSSGTPYNESLWAPALYYVEYKADCVDESKYKATINYYYWDMVNDKKPENPQKVRFEDTTKDNPYTTKRIFDNGYTAQTPIVSPAAALKNCKPVEKDVTIEIKNNTDFTHDVYYKCTYNANIHYCIEKEDGTCVPATDVDKKATDYSKNGLVPDGKEVNVSSPTIKNCKLKKDADKKVTYSIDKDIEKATDFNYEVRYVCEEEQVNPKTGIALIITAWVVGLGALGYSAYYFINARKEEN